MNKKASFGIVLVIIVIAIALFFILRNNNIPSNVWEKEIKNIEVNPSQENCLGKIVTQSFSARLSKQAPGTSYKGTFLQLSGSPTTEYIANINNPRYDSRKILELELWKKGFKILELKFSSKTGWEPNNHPDEQWRNAGIVCETEPLIKSLKILEEQQMWPENQEDRFAMGTSNGALLLAYATDYWKSDYAKANRILLQSPVAYDLYSQCKELPISEFTDFYYREQCRNADNYKGFFEFQSIKTKLNPENCAMSSGVNSYLIIYGQKNEVLSWYNDEQNYVSDREKLCPLKTTSWDAPTKYEGHSPIIDYYKLNGNVDAFVNYFANGELNWQ